MRAISIWLLAGTLLGCTGAGQDVVVPDEGGLEWLVVIRANAVSIQRVDVSGGDVVLSTSGETRTFLLTVPESALRAASDHFDRSRLDQTELGFPADESKTCPDGVLERLGGGSIFLRVEARGVGSLYALSDPNASTRPEPKEVWPTELEKLTVRIPMLEPCRPMPAKVGPFARRKRLFEFGAVLGGSVLSNENISLTAVKAIEYLSDDHAFIAFSTLLAIVERDGEMEAAVQVGTSGPGFPPLPAGADYWDVRHVALEGGDMPRRQAHAIVLMWRRGEGPEGAAVAGIALADFTVTATAISPLRLRALAMHDGVEVLRDSLRWIAHRPGGGFAAAGRRTVASAETDGPANVMTAGQIDASSVLFLPGSRSSALIQDRGGQWWVGDPARPELLLSEVGEGGFLDSGGTTRLMTELGGGRPISGNGVGDLWQRFGPSDWRKHQWWLPEEARSCSSPAGRCGRPTSRPLLDLSDLGPMAEGVLHSFEDCEAIFWTVPGTNTCSEMIAIDWDEYRLPDPRVSVDAIAVRGNRALFTGSGGLLVELQRD